MKPAPVRQAGYTIIETMIFLAVSATLLLSALSLFGSRVQRTQFSQAVQSLDSRLKTVANEASTGTYPEVPAFNCSVTGNDPPQTASLGADPQGTRTDCIFVGKIIAPAAPDKCVAPLATSGCNKIDVYTVIGRRLSGIDTISASLTDSKPTIVVDPDLTQTYDLGNSTKITGIFNKSDSSQLSGVGFFQSFNSSYNSGQLTSGSQSVETWSVVAASSPVSPLGYTDMKLAVSGGLTRITPGNTKICLRSGGSDQKASIVLGNSTGVLQTTVIMDDTDPLCP
jgi:type II secretory pathway pseudopilin PulG